LVDLYEHLGYRRFSGNLVDPVVGYQVVQVLALRDRDHLQAIQSPLLRVLRYAAPATETLAQDGRALAQWLAKEVPVRSVVRDWVEQEDAFWRFLAEKVRSAVSGTASILEDLDEDEQRRLLRGGTVIDCAVGDRIITTGTVGSEVFVVLGGLVEVRLPGQSSPVAVLDTGQVFGEIAFITDITRTADVVALTEARVLVLSKATLKRMMATAPALAAKVMFNLSRVLCERLVTSNRRLAE
jgi:CRP-like cAMP-binding protein